MKLLYRKRGKHKPRGWDYWTRQYGAWLAEQQALAIEASDHGPGQMCTDLECPDYHRHEAKRQAVAIVRRVAREVGEGRYQVSEPQPPCPAVVAALAEMEAAAPR